MGEGTPAGPLEARTPCSLAPLHRCRSSRRVVRPHPLCMDRAGPDAASVALRHSQGFLPEETGFAHLAHNHVLHGCDNPRGTCDMQHGYEFERMWRNVFGSSISPSLAAGHVQAMVACHSSLRCGSAQGEITNRK